MKKRIFVTFLVIMIVTSLIGCSNLTHKIVETNILTEETTKEFVDYKEDMNAHVSYFAPVEKGSTKYALSIVTKTTQEVIDNVDVDLQLKNATEDDPRTIDSVSCAVQADGEYYILTYASLDNVTSYEECEYVVNKYNPETENEEIIELTTETTTESTESSDRVETKAASDPNTTETTTSEESLESEETTVSAEDAEIVTETVVEENTAKITTESSEEKIPESFTLELKEDTSILEELDNHLFKTDDGDVFFLQMSYYKAQLTDENDIKLNFLFLMHPISCSTDSLDLSKFSLITTEDIPEDILENYTFELNKYDEDLYEEDLYFNSLYPCLNISVIFNKENINEVYGDKASTITNNCIAYLGVEYKGEDYTFTYIPSKDELIYKK